MKKPLDAVAAHIAADLVKLSCQTKTPHLGSNLSAVSILTALYFEVMDIDPLLPNKPDRDRFLMSKGHASPAHYVALAHRGYFNIEDVFSLSSQGSLFEEHSGIHAPPGIEAVNGSLGHALGIACGMALSATLQGLPHQHYVLMGDGELNEGSIWEAAMFASAKSLNRVTAIVDHNKWQATGRPGDILGLKDIAAQFRGFGWHVEEIEDGHDIDRLCTVLSASKSSTAPTAIVAHTVKGKGVSFMEDDNNWHYRIPTTDEVAQALEELLGNA